MFEFVMSHVAFSRLICWGDVKVLIITQSGGGVTDQLCPFRTAARRRCGCVTCGRERF